MEVTDEIVFLFNYRQYIARLHIIFESIGLFSNFILLAGLLCRQPHLRRRFDAALFRVDACAFYRLDYEPKAEPARMGQRQKYGIPPTINNFNIHRSIPANASWRIYSAPSG